MKLPNIARFLPNRYVVAVLVVLLAIMGMYYAGIQRSSEHLTARNIYYLSGVSRNLQSTAEAVVTIPNYTDFLLGNSDTPGNTEAAIVQVRNALSERLVAPGDLFRSASQIQVAKVSDCGDVTPKGSYTFSPAGLEAVGYTRDRSASAKACPLRIRLHVPYANIQGISDVPEYFHSIVIANANNHDVYFHSVDLERRGQPYEARTSLRTTESERLTSVVKLHYVYRHSVRKEALSRDDEEPYDFEGNAFGQTDIIRFSMTGRSYLGFVYPTGIKTVQQDSSDNLVLIGLVEKSRFDANRLSINLVRFVHIALTLGIIIAVLPLLRLFLITPSGLVFRRDWVLVTVAIPAIVSLGMILAYSLLSQSALRSTVDYDLMQISAKMKANIKQGLDRRFEALRALDYVGLQPAHREVSMPEALRPAPIVLPAGEHFRSATTSKYTDDSRCDFLLRPADMLDTVYWLDAGGYRTVNCYSRIRYPSSKPKSAAAGATDLSSREYFQHIRQNLGWYPLPNGERGYVGRIESKVDGLRETVISRSTDANLKHKDALVTVAITRLSALDDAVLPHGYGFAVFSRSTGDVLFHSKRERALRENFFSATDDDPKLFAAVASDVEGTFNTLYNGVAHRVHLSRIEDSPWILAVFIDSKLQEAQIFHFSISAMYSMGLVYLAIVASFLILKVLSMLASSMIFPGTTRLPTLVVISYAFYFSATLVWLLSTFFYPPNESHASWWHNGVLAVGLAVFFLRKRAFPVCRRLRITHLLDLAMVCLSLWLIYSLQHFHALVLLVAALLFYGALRFEYFLRQVVRYHYYPENRNFRSPRVPESVALPFRAANLTHISIHFAFILLFTAILPSSAALRENFDLHQRGWTGFSAWFDVQSIEAAYMTYRRELRRYEPGSQIEVLPIDTWLTQHLGDSIYLPCTVFSSLQAPSPQLDPSARPCYGKDRSEEAISQRLQRIIRYSGADGANAPTSHPRHLWWQLGEQSSVTLNAVATGDERSHPAPLTGLLILLPRLGTANAVLLQSHGERNRWLQYWQRCESDDNDLLCMAIQANTSRAEFFFTSLYPDTRARGPVVLATAAAVIALMLAVASVLMRYVLARLIPNLTHSTPVGDYRPGRVDELAEDERLLIAMANLAWHNITNTQNRKALNRLMAEGIIYETPLGYVIHEDARAEVKKRVSRTELAQMAKGDKEGIWRHFRAPALLLLIGLLLIAAYATQDRVTLLIEILGSGATIWVVVREALHKLSSGQE